MAHDALRDPKKGLRLNIGGYRIGVTIQRARRPPAERGLDLTTFTTPYRLHLGPGPRWQKPDKSWIAVDADQERADLVVNFNSFKAFKLPDDSVTAIYGSHVFEHIPIYVTPVLFKECRRVLVHGGVLRMVLPDVEKSLREYLAGNENFSLFLRRRKRGKKKYGVNYTLFECLREDFISRSGQQDILGKQCLAHQNAWDFATIEADLRRAGFENVVRSTFQESLNEDFSFEGTFPSEANESERSLYVEAW